MQTANCNVRSATCDVRGSKPRRGLGRWLHLCLKELHCNPCLALRNRLFNFLLSLIVVMAGIRASWLRLIPRHKDLARLYVCRISLRVAPIPPIRPSGSCNVEQSILVDTAHLCSFSAPIVVVILNDAKTINPEISAAKSLCYLHSFAECFRQLHHGNFNLHAVLVSLVNLNLPQQCESVAYLVSCGKSFE
jgi:hypothetical protein